MAVQPCRNNLPERLARTRFPLDDAVLFRNDLVEQLDGVAGVAAQRIERAQLDHLLAFRRGKKQARHIRR